MCFLGPALHSLETIISIIHFFLTNCCLRAFVCVHAHICERETGGSKTVLLNTGLSKDSRDDALQIF